MPILVPMLVVMAAAFIVAAALGKLPGWPADLVILVLLILLHYGGLK